MNWLAQMEARRLVLSLREMLVRFDENIAAHTLMAECVPYILEGDPEIERARAEQAAKVEHITDPSKYAPYYETNGHERPFEEQYRMQPGEAHEYLHRVAFLREWLDAQFGYLTLLDVACNDGWMAENLRGYNLAYTGIDLNPDCIGRAKARKVPGALFSVGAAEDVAALHITAEGQVVEGLAGIRAKTDRGFDAVVAFELVEHVKDPDAVLAAMVACAKPGGALFISTPLGACTGGALDRWWVVEPAGHVRAFTVQAFLELLARHAPMDRVEHVPANGETRLALLAGTDPVGELAIKEASEGQLMVARVTAPGIVAADDPEPVSADGAGDRRDPRPA